MNNPKRKSNLAFNKLNLSTIIIDFNAEKQFHQTNELGGIIWELCDGQHSIEDIVNAIQDEYEVEHETCKSDVDDFLNILKKNELIDY